MTPGENKNCSGESALALGALHSGVSIVTSYPGSPSSGTVGSLLKTASPEDLHIEWSSNEKVAVEIGIGASIAGRRALVCTKSVGLNVMIDPLMALNLTPLHGGLVILLGDDPGGYGSQNDQDSRPLAPFLEMPMMEPSSPSEGYSMMRESFHVSERFQIPVIIRHTRSFTQAAGDVPLTGRALTELPRDFEREPYRFVPVPKNAVAKHADLHRRLEAFSLWTESAPFNSMEGSGETGIIASGFTYAKLRDVLGSKILENLRVFKLGVLFPPPRRPLLNFLQSCREILVFEENEPFLELQIKALASEMAEIPKIRGKMDRFVPREGELFRWQIQESLKKFLPELHFNATYSNLTENQERPEKENNCSQCGYSEILDLLEAAAKDLGQKLVLTGDPGCLVTVAERLDAKYAIGSAVGLADGLNRFVTGKKVVSLFGDSSFYHTTLPSICNAVHNRSSFLMVVLDNGATAASGFQPHPGVAKDAWGKKAPSSEIEKIAQACGVQNVFSTKEGSTAADIQEVLRKALSCNGLTLVRLRLKSANTKEKS